MNKRTLHPLWMLIDSCAYPTCNSFPFYSITVFLILLSNRRLNPNQSFDALPLNNSTIICNLASVSSAKLRANASIKAGFFGEPYSNSP